MDIEKLHKYEPEALQKTLGDFIRDFESKASYGDCQQAKGTWVEET